MPIYEYKCQKCGEEHEAIQKFSDPPLSVCQDCGGELTKLISNTSFVLKGSGWYADGYSSSGEKKPAVAEKEPAATEKEPAVAEKKPAAGEAKTSEKTEKQTVAT